MPMTIELVCVAIAAIIAIEVAVRAYGLVDFPVYDVDGKIGYIARANQRGSFLNNNDWYFNDKNMPIAQNWDASIRPNILLIGNSVVMGGNSYRQQDKLAPNIQKRLGGRPFVWPIAAGGWTQLNQMAYFAVRHPEIASHADYIAWEYMAGGLSRATPWPGEHVSPTRRPVYATWYLLQRYVAPVIPASSGAPRTSGYRIGAGGQYRQIRRRDRRPHEWRSAGAARPDLVLSQGGGAGTGASGEGMASRAPAN